MNRTIAILGVGLIGASIGLALRQNPLNRIVGFDLHQEQLDKAIDKGVIHSGSTDLQLAVQEADIIFIAAPVEQIHHLMRSVAQLRLKEGTIITDVGSTKYQVVQSARILREKGVTFIGGHPMAGSHKSGVEAGNERLFENAFYVLTPDEETPFEQVELLQEVLEPLRAKVIVLQPDEHDEIVGAISHFPHLIAALLVNQVSKYNTQKPWYHRLAAGGFRDITRIASSNPKLWRDVLLSNKTYLLQIARDWQEDFTAIIHALEQEDANEIESFFQDAREFRDSIPERRPGAIPALHDLYMDIPDHPGEIGRITTLLGSKEISITNIQIRETREDEYGALRISFRNETELAKGIELLGYFDYNVYRRD
ncbi:prephenate dehydrogenase [Brevibacillus laterosporus]|uniref:Prephenate dehydrogenase n=1 Tax=Brevibacillus laterosporus LMG 15441 TaxID=1042163 RepID=A0A075R9P4_BRELA|nr:MULTISPECIES: prephenate dehydrogenase [Brevibacillus]AIG26250.1 arogenate dehydrogenase [Brevibacillus laterosporus LMG 15441]MCR8964511.1 prephenate dehydrogenase [Brevibacillus laterosporus]MCZ0836666.1 prephenate dehydrogenase [Brevibacillus halotolerans]RJL12420.1 prephenate dehydrogenase [Brevibacillus laterosporus]TPH07379.1 prephenate dehydrogenase [Brevibacillus laterosporus]